MVVCKEAHLRLTDTIFCVLYVRMNHFEVHLMVSARVADSKVLRITIQLEYVFCFVLFCFFLIKRQNGECNVGNFRRFRLV